MRTAPTRTHTHRKLQHWTTPSIPEPLSVFRNPILPHDFFAELHNCVLVCVPFYEMVPVAEFVVIHNGIITNYKDVKAFLVSFAGMFPHL